METKRPIKEKYYLMKKMNKLIKIKLLLLHLKKELRSLKKQFKKKVILSEEQQLVLF